MNDATATLALLKERMAAFVKDRDWNQFHSPKNLSMDIAVEAAELMEKFMWIDSPESFQEVGRNRQEIEDELADVLLGILCFANATGIDITQAFLHKLEKTGQKYPVDKAKGKSTKYTKL